MKLSELVENYIPIYPEPYTWETTVQFILDDPIEAQTLNYLIEILKTKGQFREPVLLGVAEWEDDVEIPAIMDGTHRVCAHILYGSEEVYVETQKPYDPDKVWDESIEAPVLTSTISLPPEISDDEVEVLDLFGLLRSFPINDDLWVTCDVSSGSGNVMENMWNVDPYIEGLADSITETILAILAEHHPNLVFTVTTQVEV